MKKIPSLFCRNYETDRMVRNELVPGTEWVATGEGYPTRKFDGTCCMVRDGRLFKRYDAKDGKAAPPGFEPAQDEDPVTGHLPGWLPVGDGPEDKWHRAAFSAAEAAECEDGTYELCGPKINGNPERFDTHVLIRHGAWPLEDAPRDFDGLKDYLARTPIEGIVWHRIDGEMVKVKGKDFGLKRVHWGRR